MELWRQPTEEDVRSLASNMREKDRNEVVAFGNMSVEEALDISIKYSDECYAWVIDDEVVCMAGMARPTALSDEVMPWLLSSSLVPANSRKFLRGTRLFVDAWKVKYPKQWNFIDSRYPEAIRWVKWLGYTVHPQEYFRNGVVFYKFELVN